MGRKMPPNVPLPPHHDPGSESECVETCAAVPLCDSSTAQTFVCAASSQPAKSITCPTPALGSPGKFSASPGVSSPHVMTTRASERSDLFIADVHCKRRTARDRENGLNYGGSSCEDPEQLAPDACGLIRLRTTRGVTSTCRVPCVDGGARRSPGGRG